MSREKGKPQLFRMAHFLAHPIRICKIFFKYGQPYPLTGILYKSSKSLKAVTLLPSTH